MKTKQHVLAVSLIIIILLAVSFIGVSSKGKIAGLFAKPFEIESISVDPEPSTSKQVEYYLSKLTLVEPVKEPDVDNLVPFSNQYVSFKYPADWLLGIYGSNGYPAIGIYDPVSQEQEIEGDLLQGTKIEISICDCAPKNDFKNTILKRVSGGPETIIRVSEEPFDFYKDRSEISSVVVDYETEHGGGQSVYFLGRNGLLHVITLGSPNFDTLQPDKVQEYESIFENLLQSLTLPSLN